MAVKTFTSERITSADINTYLTNSGLVYVTSGTLSSTATNFQGCFTSTYTNYRIVVDQVSMSAAGDVYWRLLSGATPATSADYYWAYNGYTSGGAGADSGASLQTAGYTGMTFAVGVANLKVGAFTIDMMNPQVAERTFGITNGMSVTTVFRGMAGVAAHGLTVAYDGIQFSSLSAVTMTGNVTIYGYRKA